MNGPHIEIHEVRALRVDANGRVGRLRVTGVADRAHDRLEVDVCVSDLDRSGTGWVAEDQQASALARVIDPLRTPIVKAYDVAFRDPAFAARRAVAWVAELDLLLAPGVPPLVLGLQPAPLHARAFYIYDRETSLTARRVLDLTPVPEFEVGVLFVHGIGMQRRAETLSQWSAPIARWINAWFRGGTDEIARQLREVPVPLADWRSSLADAPAPRALDPDYADRATYANALDLKAHAATLGAWRAEPKAKKTTAKGVEQRVAPTDDERTACETVVCRIDEQIHAAAVGGSAEFREAYVLDVGAHAFEPSSVEMHVEAMASDGYMLRSRWMLAESHWAETFWAPSFFGFGRWCLLTAPVVLVHYIKLAQLQHPSWLRQMLSALGLSLVVALAQIAFLLLMLLWIVPWERVRKFVLRIQLALTGVVGDAYVLLQDPVQRRAILDRVDRDLSWLLQRCRRVVLVAHSQGAYVAEQVLEGREVGAEKIQSLVTLGSGVQTLSAIEKTAHNPYVNIAGWMAIGSAIGLGIAGALILTRVWWLPAGVAAIALVVLALAAQRASNAHPGRRMVLPRWALTRNWFDFFATKDIVPFGPLLDPKNDKNLYRPKEVRNFDSVTGDHTTYWQNAEQVVGPVARRIAAAAGFRPLTQLLPDDEATLAKLERARISRLDLLGIAGYVTLLATAILVYAQRTELVAIGFWAVVWVQSKLGLAIAALPAPGLRVWLHAALVVVPFVIYRTLVKATFEAWTNSDVERLLRRAAGGPSMHWTVVFAVLVTLTLAGPVFYVWPVGVWIAVGVTAFSAMVVAEVARRVHLWRIGP